MTGGFLKTAFCVSLLVHAAGWCVVSYLPFWHRTRAQLSAGQPMMLAIEIIAEPGLVSQPAAAAAVAQQPPPPEPLPVQPQPPEPPIPVKEPVKEPVPEPTPIVIAEVPAPVPSISMEPTPSGPASEKHESQSASPTASVAAPATGNSAQGERVLVVAQPDYRRNTERIYPPAAIRRHEEGLVIVSAWIDLQGRAQNVKLRQSSGYELLDEAAVAAVRTWEFEPARINGRPVTSQVEVPVNFKLSN